MKKILVVEDDKSLGPELQKNLSAKGYDVTLAKTLEQASKLVQKHPDIVILDWNLPDGDGLTWLIRWRKSQNLTPVIMLTAKSDMHHKLSGLQMGSNDYITKPFDMMELVARIKVQLGENLNMFLGTHLLTHGTMKLSSKDRVLEIDGAKMELAPLEFGLLEFLIQRPGQVFSREELLERVWNSDPGVETRAVDNVVSSLRKKMGANQIESVRGIGYRLAKESKDE